MYNYNMKVSSSHKGVEKEGPAKFVFFLAWSKINVLLININF